MFSTLLSAGAVLFVVFGVLIAKLGQVKHKAAKAEAKLERAEKAVELLEAEKKVHTDVKNMPDAERHKLGNKWI